jgi:hypothetical protein
MSRTLAGARSDHECRINNQHLIDCYLSDQISPRQWHQHLINDHGLHDAWDAHLARHRLSDGTDISRKTVEQITVAQRKLSPIFPTIADARERRARLHETITGRGSLALFATFTGWAFFTDDGFRLGLVALAAASLASFIITCFVAGNRQYRKCGSLPQRGDC